MNVTLNDYTTRRTEELSTALVARRPDQLERSRLLTRGGAAGVASLLGMTIMAASGGGGVAFIFMAVTFMWSLGQVRRAARIAPPPEPDEDDTVFGSAKLGRERADRVASLLGSAARPVTIDELATQLRWAPDAVAHGLLTLVDQGKLNEDIDFETGQWHYALEESPALRRGAPPSQPTLEEQIEQAWKQATEADEVRPLPTEVEAYEQEQQMAHEQTQGRR